MIMSRWQRVWRRLRFVALALGLLLCGKWAWFGAMAPPATGQDVAEARADLTMRRDYLLKRIASADFSVANAMKAPRPVRVGLATDLGAGTSFSMLQTMNEAYKVAQLRGERLSAPLAFYLATRGAARALYLEDRIGSIAPGMEADLIVLDLRSTPIIDFRMRACNSIEEALFVQMTMADDRAIESTYIAGSLAQSRAAPASAAG